MFIEIRPIIVGDAQLKVRRFYYSNKLSFSLSDQAKDDIDIDSFAKELIFYFIEGNMLVETIGVPVEALMEVEEVWVDYIGNIEPASLYTWDLFPSYSYFLRQPF